ncbi:hydroxysteroid dehydrogenase-like protein 2 [Bacillus rossius redtenbacheri]|uniref:hydroxysteroid dehydrogenase-like protein 2 n=1 Tax=Bacillus rossius redtenbacheri TaxID=93214 RepID=UPI002FDCA029
MINTGKLKGCTLFISGASRGIGKAIALKAARDGANIVIAAKTAEPHPKLPGTIYTAAQEVEAAGGQCLPCVVDVRNEEEVVAAVESAVKKFGGIDILVNNASAISLTGTLSTDMKRYDLMNNINARGTFLVSKVCLPYLKKSNAAHILNISPPLNMNPVWFKNHVAYTMAKYGMSMCVLGMAEEFREDRIAVNALWPRTAIHTAAIEMLSGSEAANVSRKPDIMADAAYAILTRDPGSYTGRFAIDEEVLREEGVTDLAQYAVNPANKDNLMVDFFLDEALATARSPAAGGGSRPDDHIAKMFDVIKDNLSKELVSSTNAVYLFVVKGESDASWFIDLKSGAGGAGRGKPPSTPDATLTMNAKDLYELLSGKLKPAAAFMTGKLKISGDMQKAMKLDRLMGMLKSKL